MSQFISGSIVMLRALFGLCIVECFSLHQATAQITPDNTLPIPTQVFSTGNTSSIDAGTRVGNNLFHSFDSFSLPAGTSAIFVVDPAIETVLSRVTGASVSNIDGLIQLNSTANLFLINPNGIVFGPNASLKLGGSLIASTAERIEFAEGAFSAQKTDPTALLNLTTPIGLQLGENPGSIVNRSRSLNQAGQPQGLQVKPGQTIALIGGDIDVPGGNIISPQSHIELGSLAGGSFVGLSPLREQGISINYDGVEAYQDIRISQLARLDSSGASGGLIRLQGRNIIIEGGSQVFSKSFADRDAGKGVYVTASDALEVLGTGPLDGELDALIRDLFLVFNARRSSISTNNLGEGKGGDINIQAMRVSVRDGGDISARALGDGDGGNILIKASDLVEVSRHTEVLGSFRNLLNRRLQGTGIPVELVEGSASASSITANTFGSGKGGDLSIETDRLLIRDGALVSANPFLGTGDGGDINIKAGNSVELLGVSDSETYSPGISIGPVLATGMPGTLTINTPLLRIVGGSGIGLSTSTNNGALGIFDIPDLVEIIGTSPNQVWPSSVSAVSVLNGKGGAVELKTKSLRIVDGGTITATGANASQGGDINLTADSVLVDNQSSITTAVQGEAGGIGGNINLTVKDILLLRRNSEISARSGESGAGGNITIDANLIVATTNENSDIVADAVKGEGGKIDLVTNGIFGLEIHDLPTPESNDISASSELGLDGTVTIDAPDTDLNPGEIELDDRIEVPKLAQGCLADLLGQSSFVQTGRGGIPENPASPVSTDALWQDLEPLSSTSLGRSQVALSSLDSLHSDPLPLQPTLQEANDWRLDRNGDVRLLAPEETNFVEFSTASVCSIKSS